ncbi:MAG: LacI family DNA-binding transcriptional regulator [Lachnospiraceae bacterium]|nr:LacI family DNA-binding transcriptional regulator [Lachnospiraceae bacterium]
MAQKRITIRDVAKAAGVSVATVSYVVNNRTDIKLTDETRKKVLQVINLLDYSPNHAAKALAANRKSILAVCFSETASLLQQAEQMHTLQFISEYFHRKNCELLVLNNRYAEKCDQADAIICYDMESKRFRQLGDSNFIPLIALDCLINDPLFFQINTDPEHLRRKAGEQFGAEPYNLIILKSPNVEKQSFFLRAFPYLIFAETYEDLASVSGQNLLITDYTLYELLKANNHVCYVPSMSEEKAALLNQCLEAALKRTPIEQHHLLV